jgi:NDP-sugar pyrophosphorylase family protein
MRAILLAGGPADREAGCPQGCPRPFWPVLMRPLVLRLIDRLNRGGVSAFSVCANGRTSLYAERLAREPLAVEEIRFSQDPLPRGPAGCLKDNQDFVADETFIVAHAACWLSDDPDTLLKRHREQRNALTVFCLPGTRTPSGVYVCEPDVLDCIPSVGYCDVKEQLIPRLVARGLRVGALPLQGLSAEVLSIKSYLTLLYRVLLGEPRTELERLPDAYREVAPKVWAAPDAAISRHARVFGPVVVGPRARIQEGATVIGPAVIGQDASVGAGAIVSECAVWQSAVVPPGRVMCRSVCTANASEVAATAPPGHLRSGEIVSQECAAYV